MRCGILRLPRINSFPARGDVPRELAEPQLSADSRRQAFWIAGPDGMEKAKSDAMLALWDAFNTRASGFRYPVREIRIRCGTPPVETTVEVPS